MNLSVLEIEHYPNGANTYPGFYTSKFEEYLKAAKKLNADNPSQVARDSVNADWYEKVREAFNIISQDMNNNRGRAFARLFADEHPELQDIFYRALNAGMLLRHEELRRIHETEFSDRNGWRDKVDGRVRYDVADFVVGKDVTWL